MSLALYRRYRPESFAQVIGQEHVTDPLQQALRNNRVNHAYLFSGPRGCGKTTSARILARCLNCEQGPTPTPCGTCQSCLDLARTGPGSIDVIEIDAASHGGVDDARDLREKAFFGPASSRYKIYIIDEAHMVTSAGFNALLKVVEEPPEHLKFIFATTEPEKVIGTIRSRTHHYPFRLVPPGTLRDYLAQVCETEKIPVEDGVYPLVVRAGAGSVRDSMSVMDQLLAGSGADGVTYAMATALLGYTDAALLDSVVDAFAAADGGAAFEIVDHVVEGGHDPRRFAADLLERLRDLVILAAVPDAADKGLIDAPADVLERMRAQASVFGAAELSRAADLVSTGLTEMRGSTSPRLQLELICARVLLPAAYDDERAVAARLDRLERQAVAAPPAPGTYAVGDGGGAAAARAAVRPQGAAPAAAPAYEPPQAAPAPAYEPPQTPPATAAHEPPQPAPQPAPTAYAPQPAPPAPAPQPAPAAAAPGAWPSGAQAPGGAARRPGAWPTAAAPGGGLPTVPAPSVPAPQPAPHAPQPSPASYAPQAAPTPHAAPAPGGVDPRQMWPEILEAVKNRRRFTWILLSQNAHVAGFDGTTLQVGFASPGARDSFVGGGSDEVLRQAISENFRVEWRVEAVVDTSGGAGGGAGGPGGGFGGPLGGAGGGGVPRPPAPAPYTPPAPQAAPAPHAPPAAPPPQAPHGSHGGSHAPQASPGHQAPPAVPQGPQGPSAAGASAPAAARPPESPAYQAPVPAQAPRPSAPPVAIEDDIPEDDDPDFDGVPPTGYELLVRELGATVIEEISNE